MFTLTKNKMTLRIFIFLTIITAMAACKTEPVAEFKPLNLLDKGAPITIMAPDSAVVTTDDLIVMQEISIKKGKDYYVQIRYSDAENTDVAALKAEEVADAKKDPFFAEIVQDDPDGFIYKMQVDSTRTGYGFRHVRLKGNKEYRFRNGIIGIFDKEAIEAMYAGVREGE